MLSRQRFIGIDGCRAGWFCVELDERLHGSFQVATDAQAVGALARGADSVLIDIPIGLPESGPNGRQCDREARQLLGRGRAASVFPAPARCTLAAGSYREALRLNRQATGRGLSKQAWNIVSRVREIDTLLRNNRALLDVLHECHPELCFWALNGRRAMQYNKKTADGQRERMQVLQRCWSGCHALFEQACDTLLRRAVARDDIIDAMICAVTAKLGYGSYSGVPVRSVTDRQGLPMEIVYCLPDSIPDFENSRK